jgi:hypothetical protein
LRPRLYCRLFFMRCQTCHFSCSPWAHLGVTCAVSISSCKRAEEFQWRSGVTKDLAILRSTTLRPPQQSIASSFCGRSHHYADYSTHSHTPKSDAVWFWRKPKNSDWGPRPGEPIEAAGYCILTPAPSHFERASGCSEARLVFP